MKSKIEIKDKAYNISDREIESMMEFGAVVEKYRAEKIGRYITHKLTTRFSIVLVLVVAVLAAFFILNNVGENRTADKAGMQEIKEEPSSHKTPMVVDSLAAKHLALADSLTLRKPAIQERVNEEEIKAIDKYENRKALQAKPEISKDSAFAHRQPIKSKPKGEEKERVYVSAQPLQGTDHLYAYFEERLKYPETALKDSIEGVVEVRFAIQADSSIAEVEIIKSLGEEFDKEAIRVIRQMPRWIPATSNGVPVRSRLSIPLTFNIEK